MSESYNLNVKASVKEPSSTVSHVAWADSWGVKHLVQMSDQRRAFPASLFSLVGNSGECKPVATMETSGPSLREDLKALAT